MRDAASLFLMTGFVSGFLIAGAAGRADDLEVGDMAPDFQCLDDQGKVWDSRDHIGKNIVVVYFYPSDFDFCSTRQAVRYRDCQQELDCRGVDVVGISGDSVEAHPMFKETHELKQMLLADSNGDVARQFGVPLRNGGKAMVKDVNDKEVLDEEGRAIRITRTVTAARWTFIFDKDGRIIYRETDVSAVKDSQNVLEFLRDRAPR